MDKVAVFSGESSLWLLSGDCVGGSESRGSVDLALSSSGLGREQFRPAQGPRPREKEEGTRRWVLRLRGKGLSAESQPRNAEKIRK